MSANQVRIDEIVEAPMLCPFTGVIVRIVSATHVIVQWYSRGYPVSKGTHHIDLLTPVVG